MTTERTKAAVAVYTEQTGSVLAEVAAERLRQLQQWGVQNHAPGLWLEIETEELGEVAKAGLEWQFQDACICEYNLKRLRQEWIQVAAVAVAAIESLDRNWAALVEGREP